MSKYSQFPRGTLALLAMRAQKGMDIKDYINWAVNALADGFDSPSLAILASLDYRELSQIEAPEYFLKAIKELKLPIPDSELALKNWRETDFLYREMGLALPDENTLLAQHLDELAEQIKERVIDPVVGLDRIYKEVVLVCMYDWWETNEASLQEWDGGNWWKWNELQDRVSAEPNRINNDEIIAFANTWLENPKEDSLPEKSNKNVKQIEDKSEQASVQLRVVTSTDNIHTVNRIEATAAHTLFVTGITRNIPNIVIDHSYSQARKDIFRASISVLISSIFPAWFIIILVINLDHTSLGELLVGIFLIVLLGSTPVSFIMNIRQKLHMFLQRKKWINAAVSTYAEVVGRKAEYNGDALLYGDEPWNCEIRIRYPASVDEHLVKLDVRAEVSDNIYFKYEDHNTIPIYLSKSDPHCFIIDGE